MVLRLIHLIVSLMLLSMWGWATPRHNKVVKINNKSWKLAKQPKWAKIKKAEVRI